MFIRCNYVHTIGRETTMKNTKAMMAMILATVFCLSAVCPAIGAEIAGEASTLNDAAVEMAAEEVDAQETVEEKTEVIESETENSLLEEVEEIYAMNEPEQTSNDWEGEKDPYTDENEGPLNPIDDDDQIEFKGKTTHGDMFNLANNVKVTWKKVPGAKYYKVYREGVTDKKETRKDPVIVTSGLIGWDKDPGLTNGHAYRYRIVASLTGKGDSSGDSTLSYSKLMYRLKTVVIRSVKNNEPGKVTVKYDETTSGDSYVLQYCEREDMVGARTKVVLGASNTSYVIGGLKKGKTYYISIRVRKNVDGINYYTTFGVAKKIKVEK